MNKHAVFCGCVALAAALAPSRVATAQEKPDHVVVVIEENHSYNEIIGNTNEAPYLNTLAGEGAVLTNYDAIEHPSQPNYLDIFSGFDQGRTGTDDISSTQFTTANLAAELIAAGQTFADYSETLPSVGFLGDSNSTDFRLNEYERKHNPASNWQNDTNPSAYQIPSSVNQPFSAFPTSDFSKLPTVSFVIPNEQHDIHDGTISQGDTWLQTNLATYAAWAMTHNSLLIITFDENDYEDDPDTSPEPASNQVPMIILGQNVPANSSDGELLNHLNLLQTLQDFYGTGHAGLTGTSPDGTSSTTTANPAITPITAVFTASTPGTGAIEFATSAYNVRESAGTVTINVMRIGSTAGAVSVHYQTKPGPGAGAARPGTNYDSKSGTLSWPDGDATTKTFEVKVVNQGLRNGKTHSFYVNLSPAAGDVRLGKRSSVRITIKDNDVAPMPTPAATP